MIQHSAILEGDYLRGIRVLVTLDADGRIINSSRITCLWAGLPRFDDWFRSQYGPRVIEDGGAEYEAWVAKMTRNDEISGIIDLGTDDDEPDAELPIAA